MKGDANQFTTTFEVVMKYLGVFMALVYVIAGVTILVRSRTLTNIPQPFVYPLGVALMSYGFFRGYRLYQKYFKK
jgi:hypothetical protein